MPTWSQYRKADGVFTGRKFSAKDMRHVAGNATDELSLLEGDFDHLAQRVDVQTGEVVGYQSPAADALAAERTARAARAVIDRHEGLSARAMREALLELLPASSPSRTRLQAVDDAIQAERPKLSK